MNDATILDAAHAAMQADPQAEGARRRFYERLAAAELYLLLEREAEGERIAPQIFDLTDQSCVLVFDAPERLTRFTGRPAPYAALSGRAICALLAPQRLGLGLNLDVAPSEILIPPDAVAWLAETVATGPDAVEARIERVFPPGDLPESLLTSLDARLASAAGLASQAYLAGVVYESGGRGHLLGFVDAVPGAEPALARAVSDTLAFSGLDAATVDVGFFRAGDTAAARLAATGLRFDLPAPAPPATLSPAAPGTDPEKPPILK